MMDRIDKSFLVEESSSLLDQMKETNSKLRGHVELFGENANGEDSVHSDCVLRSDKRKKISKGLKRVLEIEESKRERKRLVFSVNSLHLTLLSV